MNGEVEPPLVDDAQFARIRAAFEEFGGTDVGYLGGHIRRFLSTKHQFEQTWHGRGNRVLDIGAHWLHQSYLYVIDGYQVTGADFGSTLRLRNVTEFAAAHQISLLVYDEIETGRALECLPDNSFDVILFTEIIEHITFNPVAMWRQIHRILSPGGRIVVTTPNYYALRGRLWNWSRFKGRLGGGLPVDEILRTPTFGHHWKEYSLREVLRYFSILSRDFVPHKAVYVQDYYGAASYTPAVRWLECKVRALRPNLHVEIQLDQKKHGIEVTPSW